MAKQYRGRSGALYRLTNEIGKGGEGIVYGVDGDYSSVAKIYKPDRLLGEEDQRSMENKLIAMTDKRLKYKFSGHIKLSWPKDVLYEGNEFVGFIMPRIDSRYKIFNMYRDDNIRQRVFPEYNWKFSVQAAYNLAWLVNYLHMNDVIVGDLNPNNISMDRQGLITLVDCDSFDVTYAGHRYPCTVGIDEMLPPEAQQIHNLEHFTFSRESDNFALAIHIFRLLMNNYDPFGAVLVDHYLPSSSDMTTNKAIAKGECLYVRKVTGKVLPQNSPTLDILPHNIQKLFHKTFEYNEITAKRRINTRATADEWMRALYPIASEPGINRFLRKCPEGHVYTSNNTKCPWCRR